MHPASPDFAEQHPQQDNYRLLRIYAWYRALLACVLLATFALKIDHSIVGSQQPALFAWSATAYLVMSFFTLLRLLVQRTAPTTQYIILVCLVDITALTLLMHASGGISTGLGLLFFITIAASGIFIQGQLATLVAAIACIAIIGECIYSGYTRSADSDPFASGWLGTFLFVTSQLFQYLSRLLLRSQLRAQEKSAQARALQKLNELIVQRMRTGIIVLDSDSRILLYNEAAGRLLQLPLSAAPGKRQLNFRDFAPLRERLAHWQHQPHVRTTPFHITAGSPEVQLSFASLENNSHVLVFVEDTRKVAQQAQQMKLASLGHLTASIAHEVRNPLGAISHAAQLLGESENLDEQDRRLADIIQQHTVRVNQIIENVLQLSRRHAPQVTQRDMREWLADFLPRYRQTHDPDMHIDLNLEDEPLLVNTDFSQMEQVLSNLIDNGLRYSRKQTGEARLTLHGYLHAVTGTPCLDVIDYGEGISDKTVAQIFEPFFTTDRQGTGLGLYIARELCLANQASLDYKRAGEGLSCFQIIFPHANKTL